MNWNPDEFNRLVDAEEYFEFFKLSYDPQVVNVNRLHILQQFARNIKGVDGAFRDLKPAEKLSLYREALQQAYTLFLRSTPQEQKLFKVFQRSPQNIVRLSEITTP